VDKEEELHYPAEFLNSYFFLLHQVLIKEEIYLILVVIFCQLGFLYGDDQKLEHLIYRWPTLIDT